MRFSLFLILFAILVIISVTSFAQSISLISYGIEDNKVFVRWKTSDTNKTFSVYRSHVFITNRTDITNHASKIGTFKGSELIYKNGYLYYYDTNPLLGTNYYLIFENDGTNDILRFSAEQNFSSSFIFFIPLPKVSTSLSDFGNVVISWDKINGIDGYLVYKVDTNFQGNFNDVKPIASLPRDENIFIDIVPSGKEFIYTVIPFLNGITNFLYSKEKNGVFVVFSKETIPQKFLPDETITQETTKQEIQSIDSAPNYSNLNTLSITNIVYITNTNLIYITNYITSNINLVSTNHEKPKITSSYASGSPSYEFSLVSGDEDEIVSKLKAIISSKFNKGMYQESLVELKEFLSEFEGMGYDEIEARAMIYIARCEYALGNKDEAIKILFKAKKILPDEADFWLTRFLVNSH